MLLAIPSPTVSAFQVGPLTIHAYALCILAGIFLAIWLTQRRLEARGGEPGQVLDIATYAVPAGIIGGRVYHVISSPQPYFGEGGNPLDALKIWEGGLGIWGAIAFGALGAWWGTRRVGIPFLTFADAAAPGVALAQAVGRFGNWFNNELYGEPTDLPWGLTIHEWDQSAGRAVRDASGEPVVLGTFHPIFLYEALWLVLLAAALMLAERRFRLARGQVLGLYVAGYPAGRIVLELMRTDDATIILGQRINVWTSIVVFVLGVAVVIWAGRTQPHDISQRETASLG
ncbi:MAG: prolipoprotein diacylglyceryl transferase [Dermatophilaceae bacterium]